jgi:hypothetical protein
MVGLRPVRVRAPDVAQRCHPAGEPHRADRGYRHLDRRPAGGAGDPPVASPEPSNLDRVRCVRRAVPGVAPEQLHGGAARGRILAVLAWRRPADRRVLLTIAGAGIVAFVPIAALNADSGSESNNLYNVIPEWILGDDAALEYFEDAGMPTPPELLARAGEELDTDDAEVVSGPLRPWKDWVDEEGMSTYVWYLASHPGWVWSKYAEVQGSLYTSTFEPESELLEAAEPIVGRPMSPVRTFGNPFYPSSPALLVLWILVAVVGFVASHRAGWSAPTWVWFGVALLATAPVLAAPVILGDSQQIDRHGIMLAIQVRIGLLLMTAWLVDEALARRVPSRSGGGG